MRLNGFDLNQVQCLEALLSCAQRQPGGRAGASESVRDELGTCAIA